MNFPGKMLLRAAVRSIILPLLVIAASGHSATVVSRSIGINNLALYSVDNAATSNISRDTLSLSTGSIPINIGEGDSLIIGAQTAFVRARVSDKILALEAPLATAVSGATFTVVRSFVSISAWEAAAPADLVATDKIWKGVCYDDGPFIDQVRLQGSVTDSAHYKWLTVAEGQRHIGIIGTGARVCHSFANGSSYSAINVYDNYFKLEWLEIYGNEGRVGNGIGEMGTLTTPGLLTINRVLVHDVTFGMRFTDLSPRLVQITNSIISHTFNHAILGRSSSASTIRCINTTLLYGASPIDRGGFRNCYVKNCVGAQYGISGYTNFMSCDPASDYNVSSDASAPGSHSVRNATPSACFRRLSADSSIDFHLSAASPCKGVADSAGGSAFAQDIDNETRTSVWDAGADQQSSFVPVKPAFTPWLPPETTFLPAFPGAQGWGASATGGRGGSIIHVTSLAATGTGTLKAACALTTPKIIVFDVSGVINLNSVPIDLTSNTTILGQTAPGGITLTNAALHASAKTNIIIRHLRIRRSPDKPDGDCIRFVQGCSRIVIDHCSMMWCSDELLDISYNTHSVSVLNTTIAEPGFCWYDYGGGPGDGLGNNRTAILATGVDRITMWRCLIAQAAGRVPCMTNSALLSPVGKTFEIINNVFYNNSYNIESFYLGNTVPLNLVGNWYRQSVNTIHSGSVPTSMTVYSSQNYKYPLSGSIAQSAQKAYIIATTVKSYADSFILPRRTFRTTSAAEAYDTVVRTVGPLPRDSADRRVIANLVSGTGAQVDFCDLPANHDPFDTLNPAKPTDTDKDGIPDAWETAHGLNPNLASDALSDMGGYNAIEVYANALSDSLEHAAIAPSAVKFDSRNSEIPRLFAWPNPFNPMVTITLPRGVKKAGSPFKVGIYTPDGRRAVDLTSDFMESDEMRWNGAGFSSGIYFLEADFGGQRFRQRLILAR